MALDLRPLTIAELLDRSFSTYKRHVWLFAGIMAIPGAVALAYTVLMQLFQYWMGPITPATAPETVLWKMAPMVIGGLLFFVVYMVIYAFALGATTIAVARIYNDQPVDVAGTYKAVRPLGWRLIGLLLWSSLRVFFAAFGIFVLTTILSFMAGLITPILSALVLLAGMMAAGLAAGYLMVRYGVSVPAAVLENLSPNQALVRSIDLTQDYRGRIFLILLCAIVITYATAALFQGPFMVGALLAGPETFTGLMLNVIGAVLGTAGTMFSGPIMIIGLAMAYYDLRIRKEALDLQMMLASLDAPRA